MMNKSCFLLALKSGFLQPLFLSRSFLRSGLPHSKLAYVHPMKKLDIFTHKPIDDHYNYKAIFTSKNRFNNIFFINHKP